MTSRSTASSVTASSGARIEPSRHSTRGDGSWPVDLHLARPVKYELAAGPKGAAIDPETGVLTWNAPQSVGAENVTIRVRDKEHPEITSEASFIISMTARR